MSDQNIVHDWDAYFAKFPPSSPREIETHVPMYPGVPRPVLVMSIGLELQEVLVEDSENLFDRALELYQNNESPEMWMFSHLGGSPWHVSAGPRLVKKKR